METNPYPDTYEQSSSHLRVTLSLLSKHHIPPSPLNFRTGYEYVLGSNKGLKEAFDQVLNGEQEPSDKNLWEIYRQFFVQDDVAIEQIRQELRRIIAGIQGEVERSGGAVSAYADTLNGFADILDSSPPSDVMHREVQKVIDDTRTMEQSQRKLESQMSSVLDEVETLRKELEQVREESLTDALTGLSNRKAFDVALMSVFEECKAQESVFCLLLADIDHFKRFNDTFGHMVGDKVLRFVGSTLKSCVKGKDTAARYGGEEFAVILPHTDSAGSSALAEQIRKAISSGKLKNRESGESYGRLTISIGISQLRPGDSPDDLIRRADEALYKAKQNGRNRVEQQL
ncbi:MAG: GGDEF domain-containing protein [Chromatiaceae bacterium]|nr:GGDEF domain-containing protein [Chromatiaceae bacterium]MCP5443779.1 GGDEF domain-containing protein [Chromatiaceae bacterium]